jgi:hypothetical protein
MFSSIALFATTVLALVTAFISIASAQDPTKEVQVIHSTKSIPVISICLLLPPKGDRIFLNGNRAVSKCIAINYTGYPIKFPVTDMRRFIESANYREDLNRGDGSLRSYCVRVLRERQRWTLPSRLSSWSHVLRLQALHPDTAAKRANLLHTLLQPQGRLPNVQSWGLQESHLWRLLVNGQDRTLLWHSSSSPSHIPFHYSIAPSTVYPLPQVSINCTITFDILSSWTLTARMARLFRLMAFHPDILLYHHPVSSLTDFS